MKRDIGLITFCDNTNYGSFLQTYALYKSVERLGASIELIDYRKIVPDYERMTIGGIKRTIEAKGYEDGIIQIKNIIKMQICFEKLILRKMSKSKKYTSRTIRECRNKYKTLLVGSDLVWDLRYANDYTYMLDFASDNVRKIAYAASYGYETVPSEEKEAFREKLSSFEQITVREFNEKKDLEALLGNNILHVCDPTMLLENDFWKQFVGANKQSKRYVLVYMPDPELKLLREAKRYARKHRLEVYSVDKATKERCPKDPIEFLTIVYYAEKVFTASYHGLLFSIYFQKEFAFSKRKPSNRLETLEKILDLEAYDIFSDKYIADKKIDYSKIKPIEEEFRRKSKEILRGMILNEER